VYDFGHFFQAGGMSKTGKILIVDDDEDILTAGRLMLRRHFAEIETCRDPANIPALLAANQFDAVLLDMNFGPGESSGKQGMDWLQKILAIDPEMIVVMITAHGGVETAVEAMKLGATDFVSKPWHNEKVVATLSTAVKLHQSQLETKSLRKTNQVLREAVVATDSPIIGDSPAMRTVMSLVERAAPTDANVLILGENGTGKELIARELHRQSKRAENVFLSVDLGSISESLFESELFGHRKGSFTGAIDDRLGRFQAADGGSLFLDEIGNLPLHLQAKLLSALEQRMVTPVGSDKAQRVDVRVIAATNLAPAALGDERRFRPDLLFRLNTVEISLPPLRDRREDILPIAEHYLGIYSRKYGKTGKTFSESTRDALVNDKWPGNVRALRHAIERAVILSKSPELHPADLQIGDRSQPKSAGVAAIPTVYNLDKMEKQTIEKALRKHGFNISKTAAELGLTRASLYRRMEKHDL
jgi:DNA-binding NtrC family response regulator